jgi:biopolymer transport protein ExbD
MAFSPSTRRPIGGINVTPLVDVVLVLLIIFMVLTPLADKKLDVRVPEPEARLVPPSATPPDQLVLTLRGTGRVLLGRQEMSAEEALARLGPTFQGRPSQVLFFNAEDGVRYEDAVQLLDAARKAGVQTVAMMTDPPPTPAP